MQRYIKLQSVNPYLICTLCTGYLVDATTLVECLHSFCRSCLIKYLETSYNCPKCNTEIHKTKPLEYIRSDAGLQEIVYKLVPDLYNSEEKRRRQWKNGTVNGDKPGPSNHFNLIEENSADSRILVTLKYFRGTSRIERLKAEKVLQLFPTRYLCCQPEMPIRVLKKFVLQKFDVSPLLFELDVWRGDETLLDELTLKQLVQIYGLYRERKPLELHFSLYPKFTTTKKEPEIPKQFPNLPQSPENVKNNTENDKCADNTIDNEANNACNNVNSSTKTLETEASTSVQNTEISLNNDIANYVSSVNNTENKNNMEICKPDSSSSQPDCSVDKMETEETENKPNPDKIPDIVHENNTDMEPNG